LPFATVRPGDAGTNLNRRIFSFHFSESYAGVYPLGFAAEGGQEKYEQFFQQFNDAMHK